MDPKTDRMLYNTFVVIVGGLAAGIIGSGIWYIYCNLTLGFIMAAGVGIIGGYHSIGENKDEFSSTAFILTLLSGALFTLLFFKLFTVISPICRSLFTPM